MFSVKRGKTRASKSRLVLVRIRLMWLTKFRELFLTNQKAKPK